MGHGGVDFAGQPPVVFLREGRGQGGLVFYAVVGAPFILVLPSKLGIGDGDALQVAGAGLDHEARQDAGVVAADRDIGDPVVGDGFARGLAVVRADLGRRRDRGGVWSAQSQASPLSCQRTGG